MNKAQREYAMQRIGEMLAAAKRTLKAKHTQEGVKLSGEEVVEALRSGRLRLKADLTTATSYTALHCVFDFAEVESAEKFCKAAYDAELGAIQAEATRISDDLMLGDAKDALAALEKFSAMLEATNV